MTRTTSLNNNTDLTDEVHELRVNGTTVATHTGVFDAKEYFSANIPADALHDGMNYVQWVQTSPARPSGGLGSGKGIYQFYDFWGMKLVPPPKGTMVIVR